MKNVLARGAAIAVIAGLGLVGTTPAFAIQSAQPVKISASKVQQGDTITVSGECRSVGFKRQVVLHLAEEAFEADWDIDGTVSPTGAQVKDLPDFPAAQDLGWASTFTIPSSTMAGDYFVNATCFSMTDNPVPEGSEFFDEQQAAWAYDPKNGDILFTAPGNNNQKRIPAKQVKWVMAGEIDSNRGGHLWKLDYQGAVIFGSLGFATSAAKLTVTEKPFTFADMKQGQKFYTEIIWMGTSGLSTGVNIGGQRYYKPKDRVSREAMAAFLFRLNTSKGAKAPAGFTPPDVSPFVDVPTTHKFFDEIAWMAESGLSTGIQVKNQRLYKPLDRVSREAMAAFLYRMEKEAGTASSAPFADVKRGDKFFNEIAWMHSSGLSTGVAQPGKKPIYMPKAGVSREAMAAFLYRLDRA